MDWRVSREVFVPVGESDGLLMVFPEVICCWSLLSADRLLLSPWRLFSVIARWVILIAYLTAPC
jgi:hypothetical protein